MTLKWLLLLAEICILNATLGSPCIPLVDQTALLIGQDLYSISNYTSALNNIPFGTMSYTSLKNPSGNLAGLMRPVNYGSGIEWASELGSLYPGHALQIGLWVVDQCSDIAAGTMDDLIIKLAENLRFLDVPIYLRIGYEFDSQENRYGTSEYISAFQRVVNLTRRAGASNVAFVWHASGFEPRDSIEISEWFLGLDFVDWCGVSIFQQPYQCNNSTECSMTYVVNLIQYCQPLGLPVMIAESTPYGGIVINGSNSAGFVGNSWERWFRHVLSLVERYDIRMWCYINCNWDAQPMWRVNHAPGQPWGDTRVETSPSGILQMWRDNVLNGPRYSWSVSSAVNQNISSTEYSESILSKGQQLEAVAPQLIYDWITIVFMGSALLIILAIKFAITEYESLLSRIRKVRNHHPYDPINDEI